MWSRLMCHVLGLSLLSLHAEAQFLHAVDDTPEIIKDEVTVREDWKKLEELIKTLVSEAVKTVTPLIMDNIQDQNISSTCLRDAMYLFAGLRKLQTWALRFVDSSAKAADGILTGGLFFYGSYDECVNTVAINQRSGKHKGDVLFTGKYCLVRIKPSLPPKKVFYKFGDVMDELKGLFKKETVMAHVAKYASLLYFLPFRVGLCIPSGCSMDDINQMLSKVANFTHLYVKVNRCEVKEDSTFTPLMIFVIWLYSFAGFMVLLGTALDVYISSTKTKLNRKSLRLFLIFSLVSNFRKFLDTSTASKHLSCLNGIRFMTMSWVIMGHSYLFVISQFVAGLEDVRYKAESFAVQVILNGTLSVETFFFLSGLLVCYVATNNVKIANREFNIKVYIIHRLFRILPAYIFLILFVFISEIMASGPVAYTILQPFIDRCKQNWWTNVLFINNFYNADKMCMSHGWYLATDMQFYIGALIILLPLFRWPKVGISIAAACIISFLVTCGVLIYVRGYPPAALFLTENVDRLEEYVVDFYIKPYPHGSSYLIGILAGYLLATNPKLKIPKVLLWFGWSAATIFSVASLYGTYKWNDGREAAVWEAVMYGSLHRFAWTVSVAWMVVCCSTGYGGIINYILSWKMWIPLGRLTFMAYLVHPVVQNIFYAEMKHTLQSSYPVAVWLFFGHLLSTYGVAFVGSMLIESPLIALEKILLTRGGAEIPTKSEKDSDSTNRP